MTVLMIIVWLALQIPAGMLFGRMLESRILVPARTRR
jgi:hypothetical protein